MKSNFPERQYIGRDAILRVRDKLLISNMIPQLWADYRVWFFAKRLFFMFLLLSPCIFPLSPKCADLRAVFKSRFYDYRFFCVTL